MGWRPEQDREEGDGPLAAHGFRNFCREIFFFLFDAFANGHAHKAQDFSTRIGRAC